MWGQGSGLCLELLFIIVYCDISPSPTLSLWAWYRLILRLLGVLLAGRLQLSVFSVNGSCLVAQSRPILCNPMDCSLPGSPVHRIFQARILEWVVIPFSRGSSLPRDQTWVSCIAHKFFTIWATRKGPGTCERYDITYKEEVRLQMELMLPIIWL